MIMEKAINRFTQKFLTLSRIALFILFGMASFNLYDSNYPSLSYITAAINWIGCISFLAWLYAVGYKSNDKLKQNNIQLKVFRFFDWGFVIMLGCVVAMFFFSKDIATYGDHSDSITYKVTYSRPGELAFVLVAALIFTVFVASKALVSAEKNKIVELDEYFKTLLMFTFPWIGLWFVQPRVKKL
jgi:hypothetical protein